MLPSDTFAYLVRTAKLFAPNLPTVLRYEVDSVKHYNFENAAICLAGARASREYLEPIFTHRNHELLVVALCDADVRLMQLISIPGSESYVQLSLAGILRRAICTECAGIILAHNHPSGDIRPSQSDLAITRRLSIVAEAMDIALLDHLIFTHGPAISFRDRGWL